MQAVSILLLSRSSRGPAAEKAVAASPEGSGLLRIMHCDTSMAAEAAAACACSPVSHPYILSIFLLASCHVMLICFLSAITSHPGTLMFTQVISQPWTGFIHAGGVLADGLVPKQTAASLRTAFGPKVLFSS